MSKIIYARPSFHTQVKLFRADTTEDMEKKINDFFQIMDQLREYRDPVSNERFGWNLTSIQLSESQQHGDRFGRRTSYLSITTLVILEANYEIGKITEILEYLADPNGNKEE